MVILKINIESISNLKLKIINKLFYLYDIFYLKTF